MSTKIHPTAIIEDGAEIGAGSTIEAYAVIGPNVKLGENSLVRHHAFLEGHLTVGSGNEFHPFCCIGTPPQDLSYKGEPTRVEIGDNNVFREYVSIHRGTMKDKEVTTIGSNSLFMAHAHVGHDTIVGDNCVIVNSVNLAGHVKVGDRCIISGGTSVSQFISIGTGAYIGGASAVDRDIPQFCTGYGNRVRLKGINIIGMRRNGFSRQDISELVEFLRSVESSALSPRAFIEHEELMVDYKDGCQIIKDVVEFIRSSEIGIAPFM